MNICWVFPYSKSHLPADMSGWVTADLSCLRRSWAKSDRCQEGWWYFKRMNSQKIPEQQAERRQPDNKECPLEGGTRQGSPWQSQVEAAPQQLGSQSTNTLRWGKNERPVCLWPTSGDKGRVGDSGTLIHKTG